MKIASTRDSLLPKGSNFTRAIIARAVAGAGDAAEYSRGRWGDRASVVDMLEKAAVPALSTGDEGAGEALTGTVLAGGNEFFVAVSEQSIPGRLKLRKVPMRVPLLSFTDDATAGWVGEGSPVPVTSPVATKASLLPLAVSAITVVTNQMLASADPRAEDFVRLDLQRAVVKAIDQAFIDSTNSGDPGIKPAAVTASAPTVAATNASDADVRDVVASFAGDLASAVWVAHPLVAAALADMMILPSLGFRGGTLLGAEVITSRHVPAGTLVLLDPSSIVISEGETSVEVSREGAVMMSTEPTSPAEMVSLFQVNCTGIKITHVINWASVRSGAVALLTGADEEWAAATVAS